MFMQCMLQLPETGCVWHSCITNSQQYVAKSEMLTQGHKVFVSQQQSFHMSNSYIAIML
jgi:hypothetical protein